MKSISILGCGWLGFPLAQALLKCGAQVKGSTTHAEKLDLLRQAGVAPYLIQCDPAVSGDELTDFFQTDILVITLPFKRNLDNPRYYQKQIDSIVAAAVSLPRIRFVIFTSSTSIYPRNASWAAEDVMFLPDNPRSQVLWDIEQNLLNNKKFDATIVRFAGLYGESRPIGCFLAGQKDFPDGDQPVNLIHQEDAVGIIHEIIQQDIRGEIFNACSDGHPTRRELYTQAALKQGLASPTFLPNSSPSPPKIVSNKKLRERLRYRFAHPDPLK